MHIKHLSLYNFRNYREIELALESGVNLFVGRNGQGKTNLVEAIFYAATLGSHRVSGYLPLIRHEESSALIRLLAGFEDRENLLELELNTVGNNRTRINRSETPRARDALGMVTAVIFSPEDLDVVKRDPAQRRNFIDNLLVQLTPRLAGVMSDYERVLKQRNTLLKTSKGLASNSPGLETLAAWDESLVKLGAEIITHRMQLLDRLAEPLLSAYQSIADEKNNPSIRYRCSLLANPLLDIDSQGSATYLSLSSKSEIEILFSERILSAKTKELERGISLVGPHRDDLVLYLGDYPAKGFISHGETWSYALALKLASADLLRKESRAGDPVLILDDVFAELDANRRARLADLALAYEQVIITAAVAEDVPKSLNARQVIVTNGNIEVSSE